MTELILIDRLSIKKNPNSGSMETRVPVLRECSFEYHAKVIPEWLKTQPVEVISTYTNNDGIVATTIHELVCIGDFDALFAKMVEMKDPAVKKYVDNINYTTIRHAPERKWNYKYENTSVTCGECNNKIPHNELLETDDDFGADLCPKCRAVQSFDYKYEDINEVVKQMLLK